MNKLTQAIKKLYQGFSDVPKPHHIEACPCCCGNKQIDILLTKDIRELTPDDLSSYTFSAFCTVGDIADYLYFLPRILELSAIDDSWWVDPEIVARGINSSNLTVWPIARRDALESYLQALIESTTETGRYDILDTWLCAIGRMEIAIHPYLEIIQHSKEAVLTIFDANVNSLPLNKLSNAFWELPSRAHEDILDWLHSVPVLLIPLEAYGYVMPERKRHGS